MLTGGSVTIFRALPIAECKLRATRGHKCRACDVDGALMRIFREIPAVFRSDLESLWSRPVYSVLKTAHVLGKVASYHCRQNTQTSTIQIIAAVAAVANRRMNSNIRSWRDACTSKASTCLVAAIA